MGPFRTAGFGFSQNQDIAISDLSLQQKNEFTEFAIWLSRSDKKYLPLIYADERQSEIFICVHPRLSAANVFNGLYCVSGRLIALLRTSPMVMSGSLAPVRGAIHFFSAPMISFSSFLSASSGSQVSICARYSFSASIIGSPVCGWNICSFQRPMRRLNLMC